MAGVCTVGIPASIQNLLNVTGMTVLNNFTSVYGADPVAAMGIAQKIYQVPTNIALGLSQGIMPLISYNYASGNIKRMKGVLFYAIRAALVFTVAVAVAYFSFSDFFIRLFMNNESVIAYGSRFLHGFSLGIPFLCLDFIAVGVFQATGMGRHAFLFAVLRKIVLEIPALCLLNMLFPLYGLAYAQFTAEIFLATAAVVVLCSPVPQASAPHGWARKRPAKAEMCQNIFLPCKSSRPERGGCFSSLCPLFCGLRFPFFFSRQRRGTVPQAAHRASGRSGR